MPQHLLDSRMLGPLGVLTTGLSRGGWGRDICATYPLMITSLQLVGGVGGGIDFAPSPLQEVLGNVWKHF